MKVLVVDFENNVALEGIPYVKERLPSLEITGLVARNVHSEVYTSFPELPIFEKKVDLEKVLSMRSECEISIDLIQFLIPFEEQIHYHINRYYETGLAFDYSVLKFKLITYGLNIFEKAENTEGVFFGVTPHDPVSYLVYLIAKFKNLQVLILNKVHILNGHILYESIGKSASFVLNSSIKSNKVDIDKDVNIIQSSLKSLLKDEPDYMRAQRKQFGSFYKKLWISLVIKKRLSLSGFLRYQKKQNEKKAYSSFVSIKNEHHLISQKDKLIFFPLHYQPELTTSPDGGLYSQQWLAIKHLVEQLPDGFKVLVKEHPSQFLLNSKRVRSKAFYKAILSISPKVELVGLGVDSKKILKYSSGAVTITGTVGFEALLSEKPVLHFGDAVYEGIKGTYNAHQVKSFLDHILQNKQLSQEEVLVDFNRFGRSVFFNGIAPDLKHPASHFKATEVLIKEYFNVMNS